ncbi:MAG: hypothetical protein JSR48_01310 [Verrucomicrobia bacterium]|nr:hypothetical protein [Verrucomicrobiota bacterium]
MKNSHLILALALIVAAAAYRVGAVFVPELSNVSPIMALAFCGAAYLERRALWLVPFVALSASDLWIDHYYATQYGYTWELGGALLRIACFAAALGVGAWVARRRTVLNLLGGVLGCSVLFYFASNTASWLGDAYYAKTLAGWWQAMTVGHPEFPPTVWFFRNTLVGDLAFTGLFALAMSRAYTTQARTA